MLFPFEQKIKLFLSSHNIVEEGESILVGVSGGRDSMALLHVLLQLGYPVSAAHVNYHLRGEDSILDEELIKIFCLKHKIPFFTTRFDTKRLSQSLKKGTQELARDLRYDWFHTLCLEQCIPFVATGHHLNDQAETVLFNLMRGSGMKGAAAMPPSRDLDLHGNSHQRIKLIRPFLTVSQHEIIEYVSSRSIPFREDLSNTKSDYTRNKIRNEILPQLNQIQPNTSIHLAAFASHVQAFIPHYLSWLEQFKKDHIIPNKDFTQIRLNHAMSPDLIYLLLEEYGFNSIQSAQIHRALFNKRVGSTFLSERNKLILGAQLSDIFPIHQAPMSAYSIHSLPFEQEINGYRIRMAEATQRSLNPEDYTLLDLDQLELPLQFRVWSPGDLMSPLGMQGHKKKVQDILTDKKISGMLKKNAMVLLSKEEIVWLWPCHTISDQAKVTAATHRALAIQTEPLS